jgi:AcrR family transcriptional regulator
VSSQPLNRYDRRKRETRSRIREAATDLFAEQGYEATKVADICQQADVARQTFFNHFPAKRDVLRELFDIGVDFMEGLLEAACQRGATTRERLALYFGDTMESAVTVGPFSRDLVAHVVHANQDESELRQAQRISALFHRLVEIGVAHGDVTRRYEPAVLAHLVEGAMVNLMRDWSVTGGFDPLERAAQVASLVADALEKRPDER